MYYFAAKGKYVNKRRSVKRKKRRTTILRYLTVLLFLYTINETAAFCPSVFDYDISAVVVRS